MRRFFTNGRPYFAARVGGMFAAKPNSPMKNHDDHFFALPADPRLEARAMLLEGFSRLLIWMADAPSLEERGVRASVALYCVRPDLLGSIATLEALGEFVGETFQAIHKLAEDFRLTTGLES